MIRPHRISALQGGVVLHETFPTDNTLHIHTLAELDLLEKCYEQAAVYLNTVFEGTDNPALYCFGGANEIHNVVKTLDQLQRVRGTDGLEPEQPPDAATLLGVAHQCRALILLREEAIRLRTRYEGAPPAQRPSARKVRAAQLAASAAVEKLAKYYPEET